MERRYLWKAAYRIPEESESDSHNIFIATKENDQEAARKTAVATIRSIYINPKYDVFSLIYVTFVDAVYLEGDAK